MRVFIAIDLSNKAKKEIEKLYKVLKKKHWKVKWVIPEKLHITLAFLGNIKYEKLNIKNTNKISNIDVIKKCIKNASKKIKPFIISFKGLGCFPEYTIPRVIWLGLKGDLHSLALIQKNLEKNLINQGFNLQRRVFSPHITLGRIKNCSLREKQEIGRQLKALRLLDFKSEILVKRIVVYESKLSPKGSKYYRLEEVFLK